METDRYARQRLIAGWSQDRIREARVLVAGAGALGNEVLKNLALLGVGHLVVVDFDHVEASNLSRTVLFDESDVGRPKVEAAADALARLSPEVAVVPIHGDLRFDVGLGYYRHSNLVVGCLDNLEARSQVGLCCTLAGAPYLDGAMWSAGGEVRWFTAGEGPCFDCSLSADDWQRARERHSCTGFRSPDAEQPEHAATAITITSIIAGLLAQEAVKHICGQPITVGRAIVYNGQALTLHRAEIPRNPPCPSQHTAYDDVIELPQRAADLSPRRLFEIARERFRRQRCPADERWLPSETSVNDELTLELGRDFLLALHCTACGSREQIHRAQGAVSELERTCPACGAVRQPEVVRSVGLGSPYADRNLGSLGVPPGEVLAVHWREGIQLYELTGDLSLSGPNLQALGEE